MEPEQEFRAPTILEQQIFQRLLTADFPGKETVAKQLEAVRVRTIDEEGSLALKPHDHQEACVEKTIPVEANGVDEDGIQVHFLLYVTKGVVNELEIYKDDGSPIKRMPLPESLEVMVLGK
jgi:hypothetical protein